MARDICIKVISKNPLAAFQFFALPQTHSPQGANVRFTLDPTAKNYDWLVVYDDLPPQGRERLPHAAYHPNCPQSHTVLLTYEPSSVKHYGADYVKQFGMVLTSHEPHRLAHPNRRDVPPIGCWYYGGLAQAQAHPTPPKKTHTISLFHSAKRQRHTLHARRFDFLHGVANGLPDVAVFGRPMRPVRHKAEALDDYRYHVAVENHIGAHHWTEKLSDCFLGYTLPFYAGCPNAAAYFPPESFIPIDMNDVAGALAIMRAAIANNEYEKRLPAIVEARRRVMEDYNLGNMLAQHITSPLDKKESRAVESKENRGAENRGAENREVKSRGILYSRHAMMRRSPAHLLRYALGKLHTRLT